MSSSKPSLTPIQSAESIDKQQLESNESDPPGQVFTSSTSRAQINAIVKKHDISKRQFTRIRSLFDEIALEDERHISFQDLERALREVGLDEDCSPEEIERMLLKFDINGDKKLQFHEFLNMVMEMGILSALEEDTEFASICEHLFNFFDQNKDARLSVSEIQAKIYEITRVFLEKPEIEKNLKDLIGLEEGSAITYKDFVKILQNSKRDGAL